jgi:hypothetical protein
MVSRRLGRRWRSTRRFWRTLLNGGLRLRLIRPTALPTTGCPKVLQIRHDGQITSAYRNRVKSFHENILLYRICKSVHNLRSPRHHRDVRAIVTQRGAGCDGCCVRCLHRTKTRQRTAKSCGPGAATLASIPAGPCRRGNGDNKGRSPGRARISRKAIARGKPGCLGCTCQIRVHSFSASAHGNAGAVGARLSLRPLSERGPTR